MYWKSSETLQAEWAEAIYTLCYSKPHFEAVGWWDLADYGGHFWPNGGLPHKDFSRKQSYPRLLALKQSWDLPRKLTRREHETMRALAVLAMIPMLSSL